MDLCNDFSTNELKKLMRRRGKALLAQNVLMNVVDEAEEFGAQRLR